LAEGHEVLAVDNFFTGSKANIAHLIDDKNFELLRHDVTAPLVVEVDSIFNLASPASPVHYQKDPVQKIKTNVLGAVNMLGLAKRLKVPIFQALTSEIYGDPQMHPQMHPQTEEYWGNVNPIGPRVCYDEGKRAAETLFFDYNRQNGVPIRVARIFNTYGPRLAAGDGRVISNFIVQALKGEDITIFGDGSQTRCFCYVSDLIDGFMAMMGSEESLVGPINLGNPNEFTILELADLVLNKINSKSQLVFKPLPQDDPSQRQPDISKAREQFGWSPSVELDQGLELTIDYFKSLLTR
jgi:UDP-glucuronate decarboxylase